MRTVTTFQRVAPSVVFIQTVVRALESPLALRPTDIVRGSGSGFVWDEHGHVVTNFHVIESALSPPTIGRPGIRVSLHGKPDACDAKVRTSEKDDLLACALSHSVSYWLARTRSLSSC